MEFKSEDHPMGSTSIVGQGEEQFFCPSESTLVQTRLCLTPLRVHGMHTHVKDLISICR